MWNAGLVLLVSGLIAAWAAWQEGYSRDETSQAWNAPSERRKRRMLLTVLAVGSVVLGILMLRGVVP